MVFLTKNVTAFTYIEDLEVRHKSKFTFQQDNAPAHDSNSVTGNENPGKECKGWFEEVFIPFFFILETALISTQLKIYGIS